MENVDSKFVVCFVEIESGLLRKGRKDRKFYENWWLVDQPQDLVARRKVFLVGAPPEFKREKCFFLGKVIKRLLVRSKVFIFSIESQV